MTLLESNQNKISWEAQNHIQEKKSEDWFWIFGIIAVCVIILCLFFKTYLLALIILVGSFATVISVNIPPRIVNFEINRKGIIIESNFYSYSNLEAFYIIDEDGYERDRVIIRSTKMLMPYLIMPLSPESDQNKISDFLIQYLNEEEMREPILERILDWIGF